MPPACDPLVDRLSAIWLVVADLDAAITFYRDGLGFALDCRGVREGDEFEAVTGIAGACAEVATLSLGGDIVELARFSPAGLPYPVPRAANDPWFQHFAVRVSDMPAAYARLIREPQVPISADGPQQLPPSTGSVIAYKFRDADGHPLELSFVPSDPPPLRGGAPFIAVDHSAIAVANIDASLEFYVGQLGLRETGRLLNQGGTQWRLDGIDGALVDIVVLQPGGGGPHLELLHYRFPASIQLPIKTSLNDIGATTLRFNAKGLCNVVDYVTRNQARAVSRRPVRDGLGNTRLIVRDPDGHLIEFASAS